VNGSETSKGETMAVTSWRGEVEGWVYKWRWQGPGSNLIPKLKVTTMGAGNTASCLASRKRGAETRSSHFHLHTSKQNYLTIRKEGKGLPKGGRATEEGEEQGGRGKETDHT